MAEAAACGATMVVKGTEYVDGGEFTLLTAERYGPERRAIGHMHRWLAARASTYKERCNIAPVGLLHPGEALWQSWHRLAPLYFGAGQALLAAGIPWRVVLEGDDWSDLKILYCFDGVPEHQGRSGGLRLLNVPDLDGWQPANPSLLARHRALRSALGQVVGWLFQAYFRLRWMRKLVDGTGLVHAFWGSPYFVLPDAGAKASLLEVLDHRIVPRVESREPVLAEIWQRAEARQLHLVNYAHSEQRVTVHFGAPVSGQVVSFQGDTESFGGSTLVLNLDLYAIIEYVER
jgi:hypothetical protein